jgi:hypothetical protein
MSSPESSFLQWTIVLVLTTVALSVVVLVQVASTYSAAYVAAPKEIATFIDTIDFSIQENESYDRDVAKVQRLEDKLRLGRLLREIQKGGDDLREELNSLVIAEGTTTLRTGARLMWATKRRELEDSVRRLDMLRMRFLVVYMGIITSIADKQPPPPPPMPRDPEKMSAFKTPTKPVLHKSHTEHHHVKARPPVRRLTTQAIGHSENTGRPHRQGWAGVVEELQMSPKMHQRHASIEMSMALDKSSPSSSTSASP